MQRSADGSWTIADTRAPGCEVASTHEKAAFHTSRKLDVHSLTSLAAGYSKVVSLEVKFGRQNSADIDIDNTEILRADTRGACGELVVDKVFVGHGKRVIAASAQVAGSADVHVGVVNAGPSVDTGQSQTDAVTWADDQAYGFTVRENAKVEPLEVRVGLKSLVDEGENVTAQFDAARPAWLVVYYLDGSGHADVSSGRATRSRSRARRRMRRPSFPASARDSQGIHYKATLLKPGQPSRETLVVYAFSDKRDFDTLKPAAGAGSADGPTYAAELTRKLQGIPMSRWSRAVVGYEIRPKGR